jgi:hypothetical protein
MNGPELPPPQSKNQAKTKTKTKTAKINHADIKKAQ